MLAKPGIVDKSGWLLNFSGFISTFPSTVPLSRLRVVKQIILENSQDSWKMKTVYKMKRQLDLCSSKVIWNTVSIKSFLKKELSGWYELYTATDLLYVLVKSVLLTFEKFLWKTVIFFTCLKKKSKSSGWTLPNKFSERYDVSSHSLCLCAQQWVIQGCWWWSSHSKQSWHNH